MHKEFKRAHDLLKSKHHLGVQCWEELTELVETGEEQYRRLWQKMQVCLG